MQPLLPKTTPLKAEIWTMASMRCLSGANEGNLQATKCHQQQFDHLQPAQFALVTVATCAVVAARYSWRQHGRLRGALGWRPKPRVVVLKGHDHRESGHSHGEATGHSHDSHVEHGGHSHDGHSHDGHSHDGHSHDGHSHDTHSAEHSHNGHDSHGHGHACCGGLGHGHSHGQVPEWLPGRRPLQRLMDLSKTKPWIIGVTSIFVLSSLPLSPLMGAWGTAGRILRLAGPISVFLVYGIPALAGTLQHVTELDIHVLMTLAAFASVAIGHGREGAMLLLLFALSEVLEEKLSMKARASLDALGSLCPETVRRLPADAASLADAEEGTEVKLLELRQGDRICVRAGEVIPVDGRILDGVTQLGLSHLTGEPLPQAVSPGDKVTSGAVTIDGALLIEVQRRAEESTLQRLAKLTATAKVSRPKLVTLVDAVAERWSFAVVVSTMLIAAAPVLLWRAPMGPSLYRALVWLITASPCALILATPLVYVSGLSVAATNGVLLKGGRTLDALAVANGVAFDKTGTLTTGTPSLQSMEEISSSEEAVDPLPLAASLGQLSVHPVSRAMVAALPEDKKTYQVKDFQMVAGEGVTGSLLLDDRVQMAVMGRPDFVSQNLTGSDKALAASLRSRAKEVAAGGSVMLALGLSGEASEGSKAWLFHLEDCVKASAPEVVAEVARRGSVYLLTGDRHENAMHTIEKLGTGQFDEIHADLRPEEKLAKVREYDQLLRHRANNGTPWKKFLRSMGVSMGGLIMVGDSINDAPALAAATAGISLEAQADGALQSNAVDGGDALVLRRFNDPQGDSDLRRVAWLIALAKKARVIVIQNICLALGSIIGGSTMTLVSGMPLWFGVLLHEGTTFLVGLNSLRLFSGSLRSARSGKVH